MSVNQEHENEGFGSVHFTDEGSAALSRWRPQDRQDRRTVESNKILFMSTRRTDKRRPERFQSDTEHVDSEMSENQDFSSEYEDEDGDPLGLGFFSHLGGKEDAQVADEQVNDPAEYNAIMQQINADSEITHAEEMELRANRGKIRNIASTASRYPMRKNPTSSSTAPPLRAPSARAAVPPTRKRPPMKPRGAPPTTQPKICSPMQQTIEFPAAQIPISGRIANRTVLEQTPEREFLGASHSIEHSPMDSPQDASPTKRIRRRKTTSPSPADSGSPAPTAERFRSSAREKRAVSSYKE